MINRSLLKAVADHDGQTAAAIIKPLLNEYCDDALRWQLNQLAKSGLVEWDMSIPGRVICHTTEAGEAALREQDSETPAHALPGRKVSLRRNCSKIWSAPGAGQTRDTNADVP